MLAKLRSFAAAALFRTLSRKLDSLARFAVPLLPNTHPQEFQEEPARAFQVLEER